MVVTLVVTANCSEKWTMDTWSKQTQSNPISEESKMSLTHYMTKEYENKSGLLTMEKQTQTNPIYSEPVESILYASVGLKGDLIKMGHHEFLRKIGLFRTLGGCRLKNHLCEHRLSGKFPVL